MSPRRLAPFALLALVLALPLASCSGLMSESVVDSNNGSVKEHIAMAESTVKVWSDAYAAADTAKLRELAGPHFTLILDSDPKADNLERTLADVSARKAAGELEHRRPHGLRTRLKGRVVWSAYRVDTNEGEAKQDHWESMVLIRLDDNSWRVEQVITGPAIVAKASEKDAGKDSKKDTKPAKTAKS